MNSLEFLGCCLLLVTDSIFNMKKIVAIFSTTLLLIASCLPDPLVVTSIPGLEQKIVVSSQVITNQSVSILLTKSFGALDANGSSDPQELLDLIAINDATVIIEAENIVDTLIFLQNGVYGSVSLPLIENLEYTLSVESPSMGKVIASTQVKEQVKFASVSSRMKPMGPADSIAQVYYSLQDLEGENFYMMNVQQISIGELPAPEDILNPDVFTTLIVDDPAIDGQVLSDTVSLFLQHLALSDTILVQVANISEDYYDFLELRQNGRFNFSEFLGEPINYPSNVVGGLGWFTLHVPDLRVVVIE